MLASATPLEAPLACPEAPALVPLPALVPVAAPVEAAPVELPVDTAPEAPLAAIDPDEGSVDPDAGDVDPDVGDPAVTPLAADAPALAPVDTPDEPAGPLGEELHAPVTMPTSTAPMDAARVRGRRRARSEPSRIRFELPPWDSPGKAESQRASTCVRAVRERRVARR
jgi:hypothetical protein